MSTPDISNVTCEQFSAMPEAEQQAFVIGVANGRGMTAGLFRAYSAAAQDFAATQDERESIEASFATISSMMLPLLEIDVTSLLYGIRAACKRPDFRGQFVINALASVHLDAAKVLKQHREQGV